MKASDNRREAGVPCREGTTLFRYPSPRPNALLPGAAGFLHLLPEALSAALGGEVDESDLPVLRESWERLQVDTYMNDGGRYRLRRHAMLFACGGRVCRLPHRPHFQSRAYNALNGGIQREYAEIEAETLANPLLQACIRLALESLDAGPAEGEWFIELHQFRIVAQAGVAGYPTPEGIHRDGVDRVLMVMMGRENVRGGVSEIYSVGASEPSARIRIERPMEALLVDDAAVQHAVTPILACDPHREGRRDMLVITVRRSLAAPALCSGADLS